MKQSKLRLLVSHARGVLARTRLANWGAYIVFQLGTPDVRMQLLEAIRGRAAAHERLADFRARRLRLCGDTSNAIESCQNDASTVDHPMSAMDAESYAVFERAQLLEAEQMVERLISHAGDLWMTIEAAKDKFSARTGKLPE